MSGVGVFFFYSFRDTRHGMDGYGLAAYGLQASLSHLVLSWETARFIEGEKERKTER